MSTYETLLTDVSRLPVAERIQLMGAIWDTLPADSMPSGSLRFNSARPSTMRAQRKRGRGNRSKPRPCVESE